MKLKYPENDQFFYSEKLLTLKQVNFSHINNYVNEIREIVKRYGLCTSLSKKKTENKIVETFYHGLDYNCKIKFTSDNITNMETIQERITEVEKNFEQQIQTSARLKYMSPILEGKNK